MTKKLLMTLASGLMCLAAWSQTLTIGNSRAPHDSYNGIWLCPISQSRFGNDATLRIAYDESQVTSVTIEGVTVANGGSYKFQSISGGKGYATTVTTPDGEVSGQITFTWLPVVELTGTFGNTYTEGTVTVSEPDSALAEPLRAKLKWRGQATNTSGKHKRNYRIKFLDQDGNKQNHRFMGLRNDNCWILDAGQMDLLRVRNRVSTDLWLDMAHDPWYINEHPKAVNGSRGAMVEVILNGQYAGIYNMCEPIDRKQMRLKHYDTDNSEFRGELWTVYQWSRTGTMYDVTKPDPTKSSWSGIETKYPDFDDVNPTDYSTLYDNFMTAKQASNDTAYFIENMPKHFDMPVLIDYYLFIVTLQALDNESKNIYYACQDKQDSTIVTIVPWDLDICLGQNYSQSVNFPEQIKPTRAVDWISNLSLACMNDNSTYRNLVLQRYNQLRQGVLNTDSLIARYRGAVDNLENCGAAAREEGRWSGDSDIAGKTLDLSAEADYIANWLGQRMQFLDETVFVPAEEDETITGDVNNDGEVTIADVNAIIDIILGATVDDATKKRADVNLDGEVTIADVNAVIDIILSNG